MLKLDAMIAPRALLSIEIAQVIAPQLIVAGICYRAFTHASLWDGPHREGPTTIAAESAIASIEEQALDSLRDWLGVMNSGGEPRLYNSDGLKKAITALCSAAGKMLTGEMTPATLDLLVDAIEGRDDATLGALIAEAGR